MINRRLQQKLKRDFVTFKMIKYPTDYDVDLVHFVEVMEIKGCKSKYILVNVMEIKGCQSTFCHAWYSSILPKGLMKKKFGC